jgi:hypothetical protein
MPNSEKGLPVLNASNVFLVQAYADFENYTGANLQPELDAIWDEIQATGGNEAPGPVEGLQT